VWVHVFEKESGRRRENVRGVESIALPQGSVCKPLFSTQSCFHKEIYKTGLGCVCVCVCVYFSKLG
jgi:hypothetical protein